MFAIAGGKGGCGKTTTALGVARAMVASGSRPLVVDTDLDMPDLHHRAGVDRAAGEHPVANASDVASVAQSSTRLPGVQILPCTGGSPAALGASLDTLSTVDRPVLLDCPAGAGPDSVTPLRAADCTVLVATPDRQSLCDAAKTAAMARELDAPPIVTVLSRSDGTVDPEPLLNVSTVVHVPEVPKPPLETRETGIRHGELAKNLLKRNV